jgi:hypothetical protein
MYKNYYNAMESIIGILDAGMQAFENDFAPLFSGEDDTFLQILLDLLGLGALGIAAVWFTKCTCSGKPSLIPCPFIAPVNR